MQAPLQPLTSDDVGKWIYATVSPPGVSFKWRLGRRERWFDPKTAKKYGALYNFDVRFADLRGAVGMKLETSGELTAYDACALKQECRRGDVVFCQQGDGGVRRMAMCRVCVDGL